MAALSSFSLDDQSPPMGSFSTGFALGLFAGAAGYFLFATERGAALRRQLSAEWEAAREKMAAEGVIDDPEISLRDAINTFLHNTFDITLPERRSSEETRNEAASIKAKARKRAAGRFRGIS